jgi:hypothetical protein
MASGTITIVNDTNMELGYNVGENQNGNYPSNLVASGVIQAKGTENVPVSGYDLYQVSFYSIAQQTAQTVFGVEQVSPDSEVAFQVSSSSGVLSGESK